MNKKNIKKIKIIIFIFIVCLLIWFLGISPILKFHKNEDELSSAAKRYFEINKDKLPTGERVKTLSLNTLYKESYLKDDFIAPYTGKVCSLEKSWVKVTRVNGEYKYYVYLDCGVLKSNIDHDGPVIKLNGDSEITINVGEKYKELGVSSVVDKEDGKLKNDDVTIKGKVDTTKVGIYDIEYSAFDNLSNKGTSIRTVKVINTLGKTVKKDLGEEKYYKGLTPNNYIYFSNVLFRILGLDGENVRIVAERDVSNVNYDGIEDWFKYYDSNLTDSAKKLIVKNKYCTNKINNDNINLTECNNYSNKKKYGLLSIVDINNSFGEDGNYLFLNTITWTSDIIDKSKSYTFRDVNIISDYKYYGFNNEHNFGVRPVITIKGSTQIVKGDGSFENPYRMGDFKTLKKNSNLNTRFIGEYLTYSGKMWRIQGIENDGTIKVICENTINSEKVEYASYVKNSQYNPTIRGNVGYIINNNSSKYLDLKLATNHEIVVPIYSKEAKYGKEVSKKKYKAKVSSPNMYDMYSGSSNFSKSYWLLNSSKSKDEFIGVSDTGVVMYGVDSTYYSYGIRPVIYLKKNVIAVSGEGTYNKPFLIK